MRAPAQRILIDDPLIRKDGGVAGGAGKMAGLMVGAVAFHGVALALIFLAAVLAAKLGFRTDPRERIEVAVVDKPKPKEKPPEPPKEEKPPEPPKPKPKKKLPPPPDPVDVPPPKEEVKEQPQESAPIVGLNADSMLKEGSGPTFAAGNTRMGETDKVAQDPNAVGALQKTNVPPPDTRAADKIVAPKRIGSKIDPDYPSRYRSMGLEGQVLLQVTIDENGDCVEVEIVEPSEHEEFNFAAKKAAQRQRYSPATRNGTPIKMKLKFRYFFSLNE